MENNTPSLWSRSDGKAGIIILIAAVAATLFFFGSSIGDFVVNAFDNMLHLAIVGGTLLLLGWLAFDKSFRMMLMFLYMSIIRVFFTFDPLGNLKSIRTRFIQRLDVFSKSLGELRGQRIKTKRSYDEASDAKNKELSLLAAANKAGKPLAIQLCSNNINRFQETMNEDEKQLGLYDVLIERLSRGYELCSFKIEDMKQEIGHREKQMEDAKISRSIVKSAMGILKGNGMEQDVWDSSNRQIEDEYSKALGEVDNLLDMSKTIFEKGDLLQEANVQSAMVQLDAWNSKNESMMTGTRETRQLAASTAVPITFNVNAKPQYATVGSTTTKPSGDDDYLSVLK